MNFSTLPVGSIVPFFPPRGKSFSLPYGWVIAANSDMRTVPNLTKNVFLMGSEKAGKAGGINRRTPDGDHTHIGKTEFCFEDELIWCDAMGSNTPAGTHIHSFHSSQNGDHNHGGETRPNYFGTMFIVKAFS